MSTITVIGASDLPSNSRTDINTNFSNLNTDKFETSNVDTDTALTANSDTKVPSQKAVKTYIDTSGGSNASTTVRGIVEEATSAEMIAGTATGGTGARLFLNPSLVAQTGTDKIIKTNSSGLLDASILPTSTTLKVASSNTVTTNNDASENTIISYSVPANTLGLTRTLRITLYITTLTLGGATCTLRFKYGGTTMATSTDITTTALLGKIEFLVSNNGATNAQISTGMIDLSSNGTGTALTQTRAANLSGTATEDSTTTLTLSLTAQFATNGTLTARPAIIELL